MTLKSHKKLIVGMTLMLASSASAHVGVSSGPGYADTNQLVSFGVGHGCEGSDTRSVRIEIPPQVVSVRALNSDLGPARVELNDAGLVSSVTWEKPESEVLDADTNYYTLTLRLRVPNAPFTTLYFPAYQTCQTRTGELIEVEWIATVPEDEVPDGQEPAAALSIHPARVPGWNKLTVPVAIDDLARFFADAAIVWKDEAAYSANPLTAELIVNTAGVTELDSLEAGDEIWVKY